MSHASPGGSVQPRYRGRFAPSPTGPLHLGSLFTALASYLEARARQGEWLIRIDDLDRPRCVPAAADRILQCLRRHGLEPDAPVAYQQAVGERYAAALDRLELAGLLYRCGCSRRELQAAGGDRAVYPGTCAGGGFPVDQPHALRLRVGRSRVELRDRLQGCYGQDLASDPGDFVVRRRDGLFSYHLATAVDDAAAGITDVVRGSDLLESTPRQIFLQQCLGLPTPSYCHLPLVADAAGIKLSKQNLAPAVDERDPAGNLFGLLRLLRQDPPEELRGAGVAGILDWAASHWTLQPLIGLRVVTAP